MKVQKRCIAQRASELNKPIIPTAPKRSEIPLSPTPDFRSSFGPSRDSARQFQSDLGLLGGEANHRRTEYFVDTEHEMEQQRRKELQCLEFPPLKGDLTSLKQQRVRALCSLFVKKLKRSIVGRLSFYNDLGEQDLRKQELVVQQGKQVAFSLSFSIGYTLILLLVFFQFSLCLSFQTALMNTAFSIAGAVCALFSLFRLGVLLHDYLITIKVTFLRFIQIKGAITSLLPALLIFLFSNMVVAFTLAYRPDLAQSFICLLLVSIYWEIHRQASQLILQIASILRVQQMLIRLDWIMLGLKNCLWVQLFAVGLGRLVVEDGALNWTKFGSVSFQSPVQIYLRSLYESLSIILSGSLRFPSPQNNLQTLLFIPMRVLAFLISVDNLRVLFKKLAALVKSKKDLNNWNFNVNSQRLLKKYNKDRIKYIEIHELLHYFEEKNTAEDILTAKKQNIPIGSVLFSSIAVLSGLSVNTCLTLAQKCQAQIVPTGLILTSFNSTSDWLILAKGRVSAVPSADWRTVQTNSIDSKLTNSATLLSSHLLTRKTPKWRLRCKTTSLLYRIKDEDFRKSIRLNDFDHELVQSQLDKHIFHDQVSLFKCARCSQAHSDFECPHLHYAPYTLTVVEKRRRLIVFFMKKFKGHDSRLLRIKSSALKYYGPFQQLVPEIREKLFEYCDMQSFFKFTYQRLQERPDYCEETVVQKAAEKMFGKFKKTAGQEYDQVWNLKTDQLHNYNYYFPRHNPSRLSDNFSS